MPIPWKALAAVLAMALLAAGCPPTLPPASPWTLSVIVEGPGAVQLDGADEPCADACDYELPAADTATLTAVPHEDAVFLGWEGCDLEDGVTCVVAAAAASALAAAPADGAKGADAGAEVTVTARFAPAVGVLEVDFAGLPEPWAARGFAVLVGPHGDRRNLAEATVLADLPVGAYQLEPRPLPLCGTTYAAGPPIALQVVAGGTAVAQVRYAPAALQPLAYVARVTHPHNVASIGEPLVADVTLVLASTKLHVFACTRYVEIEDFEQGATAGGEVWLGPAAEHPTGGESLAALTAGSEACTPTDRFDEPATDCLVYLDAARELTADQRAAYAAGPRYVRIEAPAAQGGELLAELEVAAAALR